MKDDDGDEEAKKHPRRKDRAAKTSAATHSRLAWLLSFLRRTAAAHVANFVLAVLVVIDPVSKALGSKAFLVITYLHLFFYPCNTIGGHLETVLLGVFGLSIGLGISFLAVAGAIWTGPRHHLNQDATVYTNPDARAVGACVLVALSFAGGLISSYTPRLKPLVRIALFASAWTITSTNGTSPIDFSIFSAQYYPALLAAGVSLLANLVVLPRTAHHVFSSALVQTLESIDAVLDRTLIAFFEASQVPAADATATSDRRNAAEELRQLKDELLSRTSELGEAYDQARLEVSFARLPLVELKPMLSLIARTRGWISCGMGLKTKEKQERSGLAARTSHIDGKRTEEDGENEKRGESDKKRRSSPASFAAAHQFQPCLASLTQQIGLSLRVVRACLELSLASKLPKRISTVDERAILFVKDTSELLNAKRPSPSLSSSSRATVYVDVDPSMPARVVLAQRKRLEASIDDFKVELANAMDTLRGKGETPTSPCATPPQAKTDATRTLRREFATEGGLEAIESDNLFRSEIYDVAFYMVSLLEISRDVSAMLQHSQRVLAQWHGQGRRRIRWPLLSLSQWFDAGQREEKLADSDDAIFDGTETRYGYDIDHIHLDEVDKEEDKFKSKQARKGDKAVIRLSLLRSVRQAIVSFSHRRRVLTVRIALANVLEIFNHNKHLRYALKLALGVALLSLPAWLPSGQDWFESQRGMWLLVTYIWVLETSTGATVQMSIFRTIGTVSGAVFGMAAWYISGQGNRYALVFLLALAELPTSYFIVDRYQTQPIGIVFALTQSIVILIPLTGQLGEQSSVAKLALVRGYQIFLGIAAAFLVNTLIWPLHARVYLTRAIATITSRAAHLYLSLARQMIRAGQPSRESAARFERLEEETQARLSRSRRLLEEMRSEISLVPKATHMLDRILKSLQTVVDLLVALRQCRETGMRAIRTEAVFNILDFRRDLVSAVLLTLWIVGQALRTRAPLPQFLPSPRLALQDLTQAMKEQVETRSRSQQQQHGQQHQHQHQHSRGRPHSRSPGGAWTPTSRAGHEADRALDMTIAAATKRLWREKQRKLEADLHGGGENGTGRRKAIEIDYAYFFVFAEHALLAGIITELESLLVSTRYLVGESSFILSGYLPRLEGDAATSATAAAALAEESLHGLESITHSTEMHARNRSLSQMAMDMETAAVVI